MSLYENHTYHLMKQPKGKRALKNKRVYRLKTQEHSSQPKYKARLAVKGFSQNEGVDFDEIFSPVVKMSSIWVVLGIFVTTPPSPKTYQRVSGLPAQLSPGLRNQIT